MFTNRSKEPPSVASTRVLRTHRMNSVETFRLQEKVKSIVYESKQNYGQLSDEIDGVRQNLVKIKGVKNNVGVSVERRKLLRDKGLRILPLKGAESKDYFTVRNSVGKDIIIPCADFYNGDFLRKQLYIDGLQPESTRLNVENFDGEETFHDFPLERRPNSCLGKTKEFRYRKITPPLRPGSRRNFQNVEDQKSDDEGKLVSFENISASSSEKKHGIPRPQTAYSKREKQVTQHPRRRPCSGNSPPQSVTPTRKTSRLVRRWKERMLTQEDYVPLIQTKNDANSEHLEKRETEEAEETCVDNEALEETNPSQLRPSFMAVASGTMDASSANRDIRGMSLDSVQEPIRLRHAAASGKWFETEETNSNIRCAIGNSEANDELRESNDIEVSRPLLKSPDRKISWKEGENNEVIPRYFSDKESGSGLLVSEQANILSSTTIEGRRRTRSNHTRPDMVRNETNLSVKMPRKTSKQRSKGDFVYDARPGKALSKGYMTMQMTVGNKQVKVYVPKFSAECFDDVVERARAKSAAKAARPAADRPGLFVMGIK